jgi:hypothetical protein
MKRLTYRGVVYQKPEIPVDKKAVSDEKHTYRGIKFHYEPIMKKEAV